LLSLLLEVDFACIIDEIRLQSVVAIWIKRKEDKNMNYYDELNDIFDEMFANYTEDEIEDYFLDL
jgi:hypothetical protein